MPQIDLYAQHARPRPPVCSRHFAIAPSDSLDLPIRPMALFCTVAGTVAIVDEVGVQLSYAMTAGQVLDFSPIRVMATGTTATVVGWL